MMLILKETNALKGEIRIGQSSLSSKREIREVVATLNPKTKAS
jgi:hypothetical protein